MTNLVERLRHEVPRHGDIGLQQLAAAEIEWLQAERVREMNVRKDFCAEVERLLDALKAIECHSIDHTDACRMAGKARAAMEPKP